MSISSLQFTNDPTIFGADVSVPLRDTFIDGDCGVAGTITGISAQGQDTDNVFTGTNEYSYQYGQPTCPIVGSADPFSGVNKLRMDTMIIDESVVSTGETFTGTQVFTNPVTTETLGAGASVANDCVTAGYTRSKINEHSDDILSETIVGLTGDNIFQQIPKFYDPGGNPQTVVNKSYCDSTIAGVNTNTTNTAITVSDTPTAYGGSPVLIFQLNGGGAGSTGANGNTVGVQGGSGSSASIVIINDVFGGGAAFSSYHTVIGAGGTAGLSGYPSGTGGTTRLYVDPHVGHDVDDTQLDVMNAVGGQGCDAGMGETGISYGGQYLQGTPQEFHPYSFRNGDNGTNLEGTVYQPESYNNFAAGGVAWKNNNGFVGIQGATTLTQFTPF